MPNSQFPIEARRKKEEGRRKRVREGDRENSLFGQGPIPNSQFPIADCRFPIPKSKI
ncbi:MULTISPECIES: hypothetical protein [unclassified Microcoleus]|uniref:hypothetical protein n=1 Tax=unclassified Microcoleus TaxID=2642155 RepID=UPI002FD0ADF8